MQVRPPAVAGPFYPADPEDLRALIHTCLRDAAPSSGPATKAIIAPHAGYVYSGPIAASAYARLIPLAGQIRRVVLAGPCHRVAVRGLALPSSTAFATPLGTVPLDQAGVAIAAALPGVHVFDATHTREHSLEVHLPFLQAVLGDFELVPLVVGGVAAEQVAAVLDALWGGPETLVVISSDLSHFLPYAEARRVDAATCTAIEARDGQRLGPHDACGHVPVSGLLALARQRHLTIETLDLRSSGDTAGDRDRVVGYGAWALHEVAT